MTFLGNPPCACWMDGRTPAEWPAWRVALSGTPGTGKSTLASRATFAGVDVVDVAELAARYECLGEVDPEDGAMPIDVEGLMEALEEVWVGRPRRAQVVDGHLSHLLPVGAIIVLRCHPHVLGERLVARGWKMRKVVTNTEHELLGGPLQDLAATGWPNVPWLELDTTTATADKSWAAMLTWLAERGRPRQPERTIDWIEVLHGEEE